MTTSKFGGAVSNGDLMARLREAERRIAALETARRLESASIGRGGLRIRGGILTIEDESGDDMFRAGGSPGEVFIRPDILGPLARAILAAGISTAGVETQASQGNTNNDWVDLVSIGDPSPGPEITDVEVSDSGVAIVFHGALIGCTIQGADNICDGFMSFEVSGASTRLAGDVFNGVRIAEFSLFGGGTIFTGPYEASVATASVLTGLNPGMHNFLAKYQVFSVGGLSAQFSRRWMVVIAL